MKVCIGKTYLVNYIDKNYPCDCECHSDRNILHFAACCYDMSYNGPGKCIQQFDREYFLFEIPKSWRKLKLHINSIVKELN